VLLPDAAPVVISYSAILTNAVTPGQIVPNTAALEYVTAPSGGATLGGSDSAEIRGGFSVLLDKQVVGSSLPETGSGFFDPARPDIAAGETVTYRLTATIQEGTQRLVFRDTLPAGLVPEAASVFFVDPSITGAAPVITIGGQNVTVDFGVIVNTGNNMLGDRVIVDVTARRDPSQPAGTALFNNATVTIAAPDGSNPATAGDNTGIDAVAAVLVFDKQASPAAVARGNAITYTLTLRHAANSTAPAYEVLIEDPLGEGALRLVAGSVTASAGSVVAGNAPGDRSIAVALPVLLPGEVLTVTFQALAAGVPIPDGNALNTAAFASNSARGPLPPGFNLPAGGRDSAVVSIASSSPAAEDRLLEAYDEVFRRIGRNAIDAPIILVGTAEPGASVSLSLRDAQGGPINIVGITADVSGHWVASPIAVGAGPRADEAAFAAAQALAGRERAPAPPLPPPPAPPPTPASAPYTVLASEAPAAFDQRVLADGVRVTFGGTLQPGGIFVAAPDGAGAVAAPLAASAARDQLGLALPQSLAWNRFALVFARATAAASVAAR